MNPSPRFSPQTGWTLVAVGVTIAVLHFAEDVLVPVALALLLSFLLSPITVRLERLGMNRGTAVALTSTVAFALFGVLVYLVASQFVGLVQDLPSYRSNLLAKVRSIQGPSGRDLGRSVETVQELTDELKKTAPGTANAPEIAKVQIVEPPPNVAQIVSGLFGPLVAPLSTGAIVVVFVVFMMLQREDLRDRVVRLIGAQNMHATVVALDDAAERVSRYLLMQTLINAIQGALVALGLYFIGVPQALLWGVLTVALRFIPYLGPVLAAVGPIALSLAFFDGWSQPLMVIGLIVTLELISNNVLEPRLYGASVGVSSFALIVATVFWTWLWGVAGLFLATPLTVCLVVIGKYVPHLGFLSVLLADQPVLEPSQRLYQRLLAGDGEEAQELIEHAVSSEPLADVCDGLLLPALRLVEQDHESGAIDSEKRDAILDLADEITDDLESAAPADKGAAVATSTAAALRAASVLCLPATDRADALAARLVARLLTDAGVTARAVGADTLKGEMLELEADESPDVICISCVPPSAVIHARYLCKRLRSRNANVPIVVGLWDAQGDLTKARERIAAAGANKVVARVAEALEEIMTLLRPLQQGVKTQSETETRSGTDESA